MKKVIFLIIASIVLAGCAKLQHLDQLLTLKGVADEQGRLDAYVEKQDSKFKSLLKAVEDKSISHYSKKETIVRKFGDPVYCEDIQKDNQPAEFCLYRYAKKYFNSEKVYFYFDAKGNLFNWEYIPLDPPAKGNVSK